MFNRGFRVRVYRAPALGLGASVVKSLEDKDSWASACQVFGVPAKQLLYVPA